MIDFFTFAVGPTRALCTEIFNQWKSKFAKFDWKICLAIGDTDEFSDLNDIDDFQLIVTTPEKCYALTRTWPERKDIARKIKLVLFDEIHLVNDDQRGPALEALITRCKQISREFKRNEKRILRLVSVSATIPNAKDIADWFQGSDSIECKCFQ